MDLELIRGDSKTFIVTVTDAANVLVNLTGAVLRFTVKRGVDDTDEEAAVSVSTGAGITVSDPASGVAIVTLSSTDTDVLTPGSYRYDVQVKDSTNAVSTVLRGRLRVLADVSRATI